MTLALDSLVTDLMFQSGDALDPEALVEVLGGQEELASKQVVDPDMQDPRFEMELSPSMPFRRRGERRLMIMDDSVAPMREDPRADSVVPLDLRPYKDKLIEICSTVAVRFGRLFALGSWGDAVWVARSYRDLRAICLLSWALDPTVDIDGRRRASPLGQHEFEEKLVSYDKRLDELDEEEIKKSLDAANVEEREDGLIVVDVLEADGTWDLNNSIELEASVAAIDRFSTIVGARSASAAPASKPAAAPTPAPEPEPDPEPEAPRPPLKTIPLGDSLILIFPQERFDLEVAAALGKGDWDTILSPDDAISGATKDLIYRHGAEFVAPIEFLSEVFVQGKPLSKAQFEAGATATKDGVRTMEVHFPRFGPVTLFARPDGSRFVCSKLGGDEDVLDAL